MLYPYTEAALEHLAVVSSIGWASPLAQYLPFYSKSSMTKLSVSVATLLTLDQPNVVPSVYEYIDIHLVTFNFLSALFKYQQNMLFSHS